MHTHLAVLSIIVKDLSCTEQLNAVLHAYCDCVLGRMGIPCRDRGISILSVALDISIENLSELTSRIASLPGVSVISANMAEE